MAWFKRRPGKRSGLMFHGDRNNQYASDDLRALFAVGHHQFDESPG
jgi:hypothetical protein